jgi:hypothetical protein
VSIPEFRPLHKKKTIIRLTFIPVAEIETASRHENMLAFAEYLYYKNLKINLQEKTWTQAAHTRQS